VRKETFMRFYPEWYALLIGNACAFNMGCTRDSLGKHMGSSRERHEKHMGKT